MKAREMKNAKKIISKKNAKKKGGERERGATSAMCLCCAYAERDSEREMGRWPFLSQ